MTQWEYITLSYVGAPLTPGTPPGLVLMRPDGERTVLDGQPQIVDVLTELGKEGWEVATSVELSSNVVGTGTANNVVIILKRPSR